MLANDSISAVSGHFGDDVQWPDTARLELLDFISSELPHWRDHPDRPSAIAETDLTDQLCDHLNSVARHSSGWRRLQFRTEVNDEAGKGRKIDLAIKPCGAVITVEGRRHTQFQTILPIECKRLPVPKDKNRDEREYVISRHSSTGGIHRFKAGHHGSSHNLAGMIAYVQTGSAEEWSLAINKWIDELTISAPHSWFQEDKLVFANSHPTQRTTRYRSTHSRNQRKSIVIHHLWINMN